MCEEEEILCLETDCCQEASCYCTEHNEEVKKLREKLDTEQTENAVLRDIVEDCGIDADELIELRQEAAS